MSTATLNRNSTMGALSGTYGASSLRPSISLLGFVASELSKLLRKPAAPAGQKPSRAAEAEALRRYADDQIDPRFADDLYAAAARHEELV